MLVACFLMSTSFLISGQCQNILAPYFENDQELIRCVTGILTKYFSEQKELTYVSMDNDEEELLRTIHSTQNFSLISRNSIHQSFVPNQGYLVTSKNANTFRKYFEFLIMESTWNPFARFLIVIKSLQDSELRTIFDVLLRTHVNNVLVVNGTVDAHLYTYNPFENYGCGKYYTNVVNYGLCTQATHNLYPYKLVTELRNCTFKASLAHRPPFTIDPLRADGIKKILGTEEYIFKVLSEKEQFKYTSYYNYNGDLFSTVAPNMTALGPMRMLQNNETDVIFGGMMMIVSRAEAFTYLSGHYDYNDELRFVVRRASLVPIWKTVYIEFDSTVWMLLLLSLIVYSIMMIYLLRAKDKSNVVLGLLDNLLSHGRHIHCRMTLKCIFIIWVWFAYLINTFYQSSLVSLTTNPSQEYQISDEEDITKYNFKPCFSPALKKFLSTESAKNRSASARDQIEGCNSTLEAMNTVSKCKDMYSLIPNYVYLYNKQSFNDKWGDSLIYYFEKPYAKFLYGFYFYKGFPISPRLQKNAKRMRENGLADKSMNDIYFARTLKQRFSQKDFEVRFTIPWSVYVVGCVISTVTFLVEYLPKHHAKWL